MRKLTDSRVLLGAVLTALTATACGATIPPKELSDARSQYTMTAQGPAAAETPAQVHEAKKALDVAENSFAEEGDKPVTKDKAYVALRKAQLADAQARLQLANKAKVAADQEAQRVQAGQLSDARSNLASTQNNLAKTQDQLDREKAARHLKW